MTYYLLHAGQPSAKRLIRRVPALHDYVSVSEVEADDIVIRWGDTAETDPPQGYVLNPQHSVCRTASRAAMGKFLRKVGVRFWNRDRSSTGSCRLVRQYRIPVFDLSALSCFRLDSGPVWINQRIQRVQDAFREVALDEDRATVRAVRLATRVLHALGLDHGLVSIGMDSQGCLYVLDVTANPVLVDRMLDLYARAVEDLVARETRTAGQQHGAFMLGTDIELMLVNPAGKMVLASKYFPRHGRVGCDNRSIQSDGTRLPLMELRPEPDTSPLGLLENLRDAMCEAALRINRPQVEWRAGSMPFRRYWTGGHIHFSNVPFSSRLVRALDCYVGLPLMLIEDPRTACQRRPRYGFLGDVRLKDHGGFEYRTPGSFVVHPAITAAAFCLAYVVAVHHRELPLFDLYDEHLQLAFYSGQRESLLPIAERAIAALREVSTYNAYRDHIDPLFAMIAAGTTWDESVDVRTVWGIPLQRERSVQVRRTRRRILSRVRA